MLDHRAHFPAARCLRRAQDGRHRQAAARMINVHRRKAALVMMRVPKAELLAAVRSIKRVINVEDIAPGGRHARRELIDESLCKPRRVRSARRIFETADGRLRGERSAGLRPAPDRHFHHRIMAQGIVIDAVFVAAADTEHARLDDLAQPMADARRIAPIAQGCGQPGKHAGLLLGATQQQHAGVRRLVAAIEIDCEFLSSNRWQLKGKWRSFGHGCGARR
jgi:hypothetical protein